MSSLFASGKVLGLLKGYSPSGNQLDIDVVLPFSDTGMPGAGQFLLVELSPTTALVGRVVRFVPGGHLAGVQGDGYLADLAKDGSTPPSAVMRQMLRYTMKLTLLGELGCNSDQFEFSVGKRSFPTLGARVREPSSNALHYLCNVGLETDDTAQPLGQLVYGQQVVEDVPVNFSVDRLKGRRSFVFARAGYGKSNLMKYLISQLYSAPPDVGLLIFDPEGEYTLPDAEGRPGLINVPALRDRISLYTNRDVPEQFSFVKRGHIQLDFADVPPQDIVSAFVPEEKQDLVFANRLRSLDFDVWRKLVQLLDEKGYAAPSAEIEKLMQLPPRRKDEAQSVIADAVKNNIVPAMRRMHRKGKCIYPNLVSELREGRVVIADISMLGGDEGMGIGGILLKRIFDYNRKHFTDPVGSTVRCLTVIEEAQSVLGGRHLDDRNIYVRWVKEGRKYGLGVVLVTQQPGAIADAIISQGDNFFVLHLLNDSDLQTLKRHNGYFTDDILSFIRNEPIKGNCYFWSAPDQPFVLTVRVADFNKVAATTPATKPRPAVVEPIESDPKAQAVRIAGELRSVLQSDAKVWLYPADAGDQQPDLLVCSQDYLAVAVANRLRQDPAFRPSSDIAGWLDEHLAPLIASCMRASQAKPAHATLAGRRQKVWAMPTDRLQLAEGKSHRPESVQIEWPT